MQDIFIYGGIGVNVIGAIYLMAFAVKYAYTFNKSKNNPVEINAMKSEWAKKRGVGFGLIIVGTIITIIGCLI